jgi:tRNA(fMet)-specific endonuclease VapC
MRRYLLDTSVLTAALFRRPTAVELLTPWISNREAATSILVYGEVVEYLKGHTDFLRRHAELREFLAEVKPYFVTYTIVARYAEIRRQLRSPHGPGLIGDIDTLIAATAVERGLTIVTIDSDFQRVPGLKVHIIPRDELRRR